MLKLLLIFLFFSISGSSVAQTLPWFFNTHTFRNWAKEKEVKTLLFNLYEPIKDADYGGFSHYASIRNGDETDYVKLFGHFTKYQIDSLGYVKSMAISTVGISFPLSQESDENTDHFKSVMLRMVSEDYKPEKRIIEERKFSLGSTRYLFESMIKDSIVQSYGEGIRSEEGVIYRESGTSHFDSVTSILYNYDIQFKHVIYFQENVLSQVDFYDYRGDFYVPVVNQKKYIKLNDTLSNLGFDGIIYASRYEDLPGIDTSFLLTHLKFHSRFKSANINRDGLLHLDLLNNSDSVSHYGFGRSNKFSVFNEFDGFEPKYQMNDDNLFIIDNFKTKSGHKRNTTSYHSLRHSLFLSHSCGYPFEMDFYDQYGFYLSLADYIGCIDTSSSFINLKTKSTKHRNGEVKKVKQYCINEASGDWMLRSKETYDKKGHLESLNLFNNNLLASLGYFAERSDLGYFESGSQLENCIINYDENSNVIIHNQDNEVVVKTTQTELILTNPYHNSFNSFCASKSNDSHIL